MKYLEVIINKTFAVLPKIINLQSNIFLCKKSTVITSFNPFEADKTAANGNPRIEKIETISQVSLKLTIRINLGRRGAIQTKGKNPCSEILYRKSALKIIRKFLVSNELHDKVSPPLSIKLLVCIPTKNCLLGAAPSILWEYYK